MSSEWPQKHPSAFSLLGSREFGAKAAEGLDLWTFYRDLVENHTVTSPIMLPFPNLWGWKAGPASLVGRAFTPDTLSFLFSLPRIIL